MHRHNLPLIHKKHTVSHQSLYLIVLIRVTAQGKVRHHQLTVHIYVYFREKTIKRRVCVLNMENICKIVCVG